MKNVLELNVTVAALATTFGLLAAAGCARQDAGVETATVERQAALVATVRIAGHLANPGNVSVAGVPIALSGSQQAVAITDAEGDFLFTVPAGSYSIRPTKTGASFSPDVVNLNNLNADSFQALTCTAGCDVPSSIVPEKELVITDLSVTTDARTSDAGDGPWSFRGLMEQMTPTGMDPADFIEAWINEFRAPPPNGKLVNGFPVDDRNADFLRFLWPKRADGKVDPSHTPFRLRAIVNRADMHAATNGEVRFVFGVLDAVDQIQIQQPMAVIFEYDLPAVDPTTGAALTRQSWVGKFHGLDTKSFGVDYSPALQAVTDLFTRRGTGPGRPNGSSLINLRSNEVMMDPNKCGECFGKWQLRSFRLVDGGALQLSTTPQNPDDTAHDITTAANATLTSYLNTDGVRIRAGFATVPASIIGGQATAPLFWNAFSGPVDPVVRHAFAGETCGGCHLTEINSQNVDDLFHVSGLTNFDGTSRLSPFETGIEIPRRAIFARHELDCTGTACAVGAEAMLH